MKKLIRGIVDFRQKVLPGYREMFARLALGQKPDSLFIACSDSRVVPNLFASTDPGDLFVIRNVGNLIPPCGKEGVSEGDLSEAAAIEFAVSTLQVGDIVVCGHSECGAMQEIACGCSHLSQVREPHLKQWLAHGQPAYDRFMAMPEHERKLAPHNEISRLNVLLQLEHLRSYPIIQERIESGKLRLHGWWFDIPTADVYAFEPSMGRFVLIDEEEAEIIIKKMD